MTTTSTARTSTEVTLYDGSAKPRWRKRLKESKVQSIIFAVAALVFAVIWTSVLYVTGELDNTTADADGLAGPEFIYDQHLAERIALYTFVLMIWPLVLVFVKRRQVLARLSVIVGSVVVPLLLLGVWVRWSQFTSGLAEKLFALGGVPGFLALLFTAAAAVLLTRYSDDDPTLEDDKAKLPYLKRAIAQTEAEHVPLNKERVIREAHLTDLRSAYEALHTVEEEKSAAYTAAQDAHNTSPLVVERNEVKAKIDSIDLREPSTADRAALRVALQKLGPDLKKATGALKVEFEADFAKLEAELTAMQALSTELAAEKEPLVARLTVLDAVIETSPTKVALDLALKNSDSAAKDAKDALEAINGNDTPELPGALKRLDAASTDASTKAKVLEQQKADYAELELSVKERGQTASSLWRDIAFLPVTFLVVAWLFGYPSWYGWVLAQF